jgi:GT2 family glycosyltransferase
VAFEREFFRSTGGYDETLFRFGGMSEDWELGLRMRRRGLAIWHDPSLFVRHEPAMSGGCGVRSASYVDARARLARAVVFAERVSVGPPFRLAPRHVWPIVRTALLSSLGRPGARRAVVRHPLWHLRTLANAMRESREFAALHAWRYADPARVDHLAQPTARVLSHVLVERNEVATAAR